MILRVGAENVGYRCGNGIRKTKGWPSKLARTAYLYLPMWKVVRVMRNLKKKRGEIQDVNRLVEEVFNAPDEVVDLWTPHQFIAYCIRQAEPRMGTKSVSEPVRPAEMKVPIPTFPTKLKKKKRPTVCVEYHGSCGAP